MLRLIALGHTNAEIAEPALSCRVRTVETHRSHIQQKLRLSTRAELVGYALERGLIKPSGEPGRPPAPASTAGRPRPEMRAGRRLTSGGLGGTGSARARSGL